MTNAFTHKPDITRFIKRVRQAHVASRTGTKSAERMTVLQTSALTPFLKVRREPRP